MEKNTLRKFPNWADCKPGCLPPFWALLIPWKWREAQKRRDLPTVSWVISDRARPRTSLVLIPLNCTRTWVLTCVCAHTRSLSAASCSECSRNAGDPCRQPGSQKWVLYTIRQQIQAQRRLETVPRKQPCWRDRGSWYHIDCLVPRCLRWVSPPWSTASSLRHSWTFPECAAPRDSSCAPVWKADGAQWPGCRPHCVRSPFNEACGSSSTLRSRLPFNSLLLLLFSLTGPSVFGSPCSVVWQGPGARQSNHSGAST